MTRRFATYLAVTGVLAALAVALPQMVFAGLLLGIVPGLVLGAMPSLFLYSIPWWGTRALVLAAARRAGLDPTSRPVRRVSGGIAVAIIAVPAVLLPRALNAPLERSAALLRADDREVAGPIGLPAVIAVVLPREHDGPRCETLCQRLLYNRAVSRVILADAPPPGKTDQIAKPATAFWVERGDHCPEPALSRREITWPTDFPLERGGDPVSRVRARVAAGDCLLRGPGRIEEAGGTISYRQIKKAVSPYGHPWKLQLDTLEANRLEIVEAGGAVLYRRTEIKIEPLTAPLLIETRAGFMTTVTYAGWARRKKTDAPLGPDGRDVLPGLLGTASRPPDMP